MSDPYKAPATPIYPEQPSKRLPIVWNPLVWLVLMTVIVGVEVAWFGLLGKDAPEQTARLWGLLFGVLVAWWVHSDRRARGVGVPWEFDAFVLFLWPIVLPYYLYRTRGWGGLLLAAGFWLLFLVPTLASMLTYVTATDYPSPTQ